MYILTTVKRCSVVTTRQEGLKSNVGKSIFFICEYGHEGGGGGEGGTEK